jgi:hypothetical protein
LDLQPTLFAASVGPAQTSYVISYQRWAENEGTYVQWTTMTETGKRPSTTNIHIIAESSARALNIHKADILVRTKPEEITETWYWTFYFPLYVVCSTLMDLTVADDDDVRCGVLAAQGSFEHY